MPDVVVTAISSCLWNTEFMTYFNHKQKKKETLPKHILCPFMCQKSFGLSHRLCKTYFYKQKNLCLNVKKSADSLKILPLFFFYPCKGGKKSPQNYFILCAPLYVCSSFVVFNNCKGCWDATSMAPMLTLMFLHYFFHLKLNWNWKLKKIMSVAH